MNKLTKSLYLQQGGTCSHKLLVLIWEFDVGINQFKYSSGKLCLIEFKLELFCLLNLHPSAVNQIIYVSNELLSKFQ